MKMDFGLKDKKILITGGSRGLGKTLVSAFADEGANVFFTARSNSDLEQLCCSIGGEKEGHAFFAFDLMAEGAIKALHQHIEKNFGCPDIIIHNIGGTLGIRDNFSSLEGFEKVWRLNFGISAEINRLFIPKMIEKGWGRVVHISSSSAVMADASLPYSSAKAALNNYVKGLGQRIADKGVLVNSVMPGPFIAENNHWDIVKKNDPDRYEQFVNKRMSIKRLGTTDEIAQFVLFLSSELATLFVGTSIAIDGGIH